MPGDDHTNDPQESAEASTSEKGGNSCVGGRFFHAIDWLSFGITTLAALAVYLATIAPEVNLEDGGSFVTGAAYAGVPDCPGFPLWTLYSWLWIKLIPYSNVAWRVAVGSAWAAALACGLTAVMVSRGGVLLLGNRPAFSSLQPVEQNWLRCACGVVAGLALGFCETIWSQVAKCDIWAVSVLLFTIMQLLLMRWTFSISTRRFFYAGVFLFGLVLTNSQFWIVFAPGLVVWVLLNDAELGRDFFLLAAILLISGLMPFWDDHQIRYFPFVYAFWPLAIWPGIIAVKTRRIATQWKATLLCGLFFFTGLAPYIYPALASMTNPPLNWAYPRTVEGFWHLVSRGQYDKLNGTHDLVLFIEHLWAIGLDVGGQFGWLYFVFIPLPFCLWRRMRPDARRWMMGLITSFVCMGPMMVAMLNPTRDRQTSVLVQQYFSALYVVLAVWAGLGLMLAGGIIIITRLGRIP
jgi:hypothetical protein